MFRRASIVSSVALALVLALGFGTVWTALIFWGAALIDQATREPSYRQLVVRADGTPLLMSYTYGRSTYSDLAGKDLPFAFGESPWTIAGASLGLPQKTAGPWFKLSWYQRLKGFSDFERAPAYWYFLHDGRREGSGYFEGFDSVSKLPLGYIGQKGYSADLPPREEWLPVEGRRLETGTAFDTLLYDGGREPGYYGSRLSDRDMPPWIVHMVSGDRLLEIDFRKRSVSTLLETPGIVSVGMLQRAVSSSIQSKSDKDSIPLKLELAVRFSDRVLVLHPRGGQRRTYALPAGVRSRDLQFFELSGNAALLVSRRYRMDGGQAHGDVLRWIDPEGRVRREEEVVLGTTTGIYSYPATARWLPAIALPSLVPGALASTIASGAAEIEVPGEDVDLGPVLAAGIATAWPAVLALAALSAGLAWLVRRRQVRYASPGTRLWIAVVLLFGVPGFLGYLLHRRWPVLLACPACERPIPRDRDACAVCGEAFPPPPPKGIEVFA